MWLTCLNCRVQRKYSMMPSDSTPYRVVMPSGHLLYPLCSEFCVSVARGWTAEECLHRIFDGTALGYEGGEFLLRVLTRGYSNVGM